MAPEKPTVPAVKESSDDISRLKDLVNSYRNMLDNASEGIVRVDHKGIVQHVNQAFATITGIALEEIVGQNSTALAKKYVSTSQIPHLLKIISKVITGNPVDTFEIDFNNKILEVNVDVDRESTGITGVIRDITQRKEVEQSMVHSENKYRSLFEMANDGIFITRGSEIIECNSAVLKMFNCTEDYIIGKSPGDLSPEVQPGGALSKEKAIKIINNALEGIPQQFEWNHQRQDDSQFECEISISRMVLETETLLIATIRDVSSFKQAYRQLELSEHKFRDMAELMPETSYECNLEGRITYTNNFALEKFGYSRGDLKGGINIFDIIAPQDHERAANNLKELYSGKISVPSQYTAIRKDKTRFPVIVYSSLILQDNKPVGIRGIVVDITRRVETENKVNELNQSLMHERRMFMRGPVVIFYWQFSGAEPVEYVSSNVVDVLGYTEEEFLSGEVIYQDLVPEEDWEVVHREAIEHADAGDPSFEHTPYRIRKKDGQLIWIRDYTTIIRADDGSVKNYLGYIIDISQQMEAEFALRENEAKYRSIVDNSLEGIYIIQDQEFQYCNQRFADLFGYDNTEEIVGKQVQELVNAADWDRISKSLQRRESGQDEMAQNTFKAIKKNGREVIIESLGSRIMYNGRPAVQGVSRDVSEKVHLEIQLQQAQKMEAIGQLAGGVAHDFNNMLGGIIGFSELAIYNLDDIDIVEKYLKLILEKCNSAAVLVRQLLAFSRQQVLQIQQLNLNINVSHSVSFLQRVIGEHIAVELNLADDLYPINADATALEQIITNLCINARDAMPDGGKLIITSENISIEEDDQADLSPGHYAKLSIADTGLGIEESIQDQIFEPFFTTKDVGKGTGLGLAMVYGLVKQHDGTIICTSEPGIGAEFSIYIPAATVATQQEEIWVESAAEGGKETILLVEDDEELLSITTAILQEYDYDIIGCSNGKTAYQYYHKNRDKIDLIITDIVMPELGGVELYEMIKQQSPEISFLFISGYAPSQAFKKYYDQDRVKLLQKPYRKIELAKTVRDILNEKKTGEN